MPHYEYECTVCKHRFEVLQKFSDDPMTACVQCGAPVRRLLSSPAIQFKGTGWYVTDYAGKGGAGSEGAKSDGGGDTKTSAAPDTSSKASSSSSDTPKT